MCGFVPGTKGDGGAVRDTPGTVGLGGWKVTLPLRWRVTSSGEEALALLVAVDSDTGRSMRVTVELDEIDFCIPTACGFTEGGRVIEIDEVVVLGTVLFSARWFTLNGEGARKETADLGLEAFGETCAVLRTWMLAVEFILAFGRTVGDGEGSLLGDGGRLGIFRRGGMPFVLRGDGGRSCSSLAVTYVEKLAGISGKGEETETDFRLYGCHQPLSQQIATPGSFRTVVVVQEGKSKCVITSAISTRLLYSSGRISRAYPPPS